MTNMSKSNNEEYAYLKDDYGNIITDISHEVRHITVQEFMDKHLRILDAVEYQQEYILDISNTDYEGCLETNAIFVKCNNTNITRIEAHKADEIECRNCENLESIQAPQCMRIAAENSPSLTEENIESNQYYCIIEGVGERKNPIKIKIPI